MGFVDDDQIPLSVLELLLKLLAAGQLIEACDQQIGLLEVVTRGALLLFLTTEDFELHAEFFQQFILPLLGQGAR